MPKHTTAFVAILDALEAAHVLVTESLTVNDPTC